MSIATRSQKDDRAGVETLHGTQLAAVVEWEDRSDQNGYLHIYRTNDSVYGDISPGTGICDLEEVKQHDTYVTQVPLDTITHIGYDRDVVWRNPQYYSDFDPTPTQYRKGVAVRGEVTIGVLADGPQELRNVLEPDTE